MTLDAQVKPAQAERVVDISFVVPAYNEADNLVALMGEIEAVMREVGRSYEVVIVNDGSRDESRRVIAELESSHPGLVRAVHFRHNQGKAAALHAGFRAAAGETIITMDADLQDDPHEIPRMLAELDKGYDLVSGWKQGRKDSFVKNKTSKLFNAATNAISEVKLHDFNCGFKAYRAEAARSVNLYGELHRYVPVLVAAQGYKVTEIRVNHRKRLNGKSKYGPVRFLNGFFDLVTILFITKFSSRPLHMFGYIGLSVFGLGLLGGLYLTYVKFAYHESIGTHPLLLLSVMLMIVGVQIMVSGITGEFLAMIHQKERNPVYDDQE